MLRSTAVMYRHHRRAGGVRQRAAGPVGGEQVADHETAAVEIYQQRGLGAAPPGTVDPHRDLPGGTGDERVRHRENRAPTAPRRSQTPVAVAPLARGPPRAPRAPQYGLRASASMIASVTASSLRVASTTCSIVRER